MPEELRTRAAAGDTDAALHLAKKLIRGRGEGRNFEEAVEWFDAAARGESRAYDKLLNLARRRR